MIVDTPTPARVAWITLPACVPSNVMNPADGPDATVRDRISTVSGPGVSTSTTAVSRNRE